MNLPIKHKDLQAALDEEVSDLVGNSFGTLMKFDANTAKYSIIGGDEVPLGREYIAHCDQFARGHVLFVDKKPVAIEVKRITEGRPKARKELDQPEMIGRSDDPWVYQRYLPLEDHETGEMIVFVGKSVGSKIALGNLLQTFSAGGHRGLPIVKLALGSFPTKEYGRRNRPEFAIVGWTGNGAAGGNYGSNSTKTIEAEGPPETDPEDPGYDPLDLDR